MKTITTSELSPGYKNETVRYMNQLYVIGRNWIPGCRCTYIYLIRSKEDEIIKKHLQEGSIEKYVKNKAGDFQDIEDFRLEFYDETIHFTNEDSWDLFEQAWLEEELSA